MGLLVAGARRTYQVSYQLKLAELHCGQVAASFFASCTRRFATNELSVIRADIYAKVGPAANLLGLEIIAIHRATFVASTTTNLSPNSMSFFLTSLGRLRLVSILEGLSLLVLLGIAMPLKYLFHQPEAVRIVGLIHGVLFVSYVLLLVQNAIELRWPLKKAGLGLLLSVLPFGAFYAERRLFQDQQQETLLS